MSRDDQHLDDSLKKKENYIDILNRSKRKLMKNNQKMFSQYEKIQQGIQNVPNQLISYQAMADQKNQAQMQ